jgi:hypothetical protein
MRFASIIISLCFLLTASGCTHLQLSRSTVQQAGTITDLHYKQVLRNLASFHCNGDVLPTFAVVGTGGTSITDQGGANVELEWDTSTFIRKMLGLQLTREVQEQWTLAPVVNPDKLRAIKAVFQLSVYGQANDSEADALLKSYLGDQYMDWIMSGWHHCGAKRDVPRNVCYVASCGPCHVWVDGDGIEGLSRLTLIILDIATLDPNVPDPAALKTVEKYKYREDGKLESMERTTEPDGGQEVGKKPRANFRKDFYNPLQSQIQIKSGGG